MIQIKKRKFSMTQEERFIGITGENNMETREFRIDRMYNGVDLATLACFMEVVPINLETAPYINILTTITEPTQLRIIWEVQAHDLVNSGKLEFDLKFVSPEYVPTEGTKVEDEYIIFQTHRDYFRIGEDAINAVAFAQDIAPPALEQAIAKATQQANIAGEHARMTTEQVAQAEEQYRAIMQAADEMQELTETALDAVADGIRVITTGVAQVEERTAEAKEIVITSVKNTEQANITLNKATALMERVEAENDALAILQAQLTKEAHDIVDQAEAEAEKVLAAKQEMASTIDQKVADAKAEAKADAEAIQQEMVQQTAELHQQMVDETAAVKDEAQAAANRAENAQTQAESSRNIAINAANTAQHAAANAAADAANGVEGLLAQHVQESTEAKNNAEGFAQDAAASAQAANEYAQTVNPDEIRSMIELRGDNLEFDESEGLLYLTAGGTRISDGIKVITTGGGGGGGESNNAVLSLKNTTGWLYKSISLGAACVLQFNWSSIEDEMPTGNGVLKVSVNGTTKVTRQIEQGDDEIDVGEFLSAGTCAVKLNVTDTYGNSRSINFNITAVSLGLTSTFDATIAYEGEIIFPYTPTAAVTKTMHFVMDNNEIGTATVLASGRQQTFTIPAQTHGMHIFEAWYDAEIDGETVESDKLRYALICKVQGNTTPIIATDWNKATVEQFDTLNIPYIVYDPVSLSTKVSLSDGDTPTELTVDRTKQVWSYRVANEGAFTLSIACGTTIVLLEMTAAPTSIDVQAETNDLSLYLTSYGRNNHEDTPSEWKYGDVAATLTGFNYTSDGWMNDDEGITVLRVSGDARVEIPVQLFASDFRTTGKTIEIEFASRSVLDYDAILATCWTGERGLKITAQQALLKSEKSEVATRYKEDDHLRLSFVIEKRSSHRLIIAYVNGIISGMIQYPDTDDFSQAVPVSISLGSNDCTLDIYNIRVYENDLTRFQVLDNWIADTQNLLDKRDRFERNDIFDEYGVILPTTLKAHQCYLILRCPVLPQFKGDKKTCSGTYVDPVNPKNSFTFTNAEIDVQGTSSQYYYVKNFKIKFKGGFILWNGTSATVYAMNENAVPTAEFTFKADVASSEGANNVVLAELYNELCPVKTPAQERDKRVRQTIEGHPIVVFHDSGNGPQFIGKYNFNNDKGTAEVFGFADGDESWEILENGNALVSFKSTDFTNWKTSFEARFPDKNTNITRLKQFVTWVASTDTTVAGLTEDEKTARLTKFKNEIETWVNVDDAIFYYLFTLIFLCIDQREKNAFPTYNAEMSKWLWLFYDADSSIGTDNKGNLTFEYWMEDIDFTEAGDPVFNGQNNVFWTNLRLCFADDIKAEYQRLRTDIREDGRPLLSYEVVDQLFEAHQSQWSEAIYNEDAWRKAVEPLEKDNDALYLPMQQGKKEQHFKHWMYNRFRYLDSKFETGTAMSDRITMRAHAQGSVFLTSYINMYGQVYFNAAMDEHRMARDTETEFVWRAEGAEDAVIGVNNAAMLTSLGDLSPLMLELIDISGALHLTYLKVGDGTEGYINDNLTSLTLGNNTLLRTLDVRNCTNLKQAIDAGGCANIEEVYFDGTSVTGVALPNGGNLKKLHLPATVTDLTLLNQTKLTEFVMPSYANITTLRLENVASVVDGWTILHQMPANSRVRMIGFDWTQNSAADILSLYDYLDTMRGLDENGNNVDKAQMQGVIHIDFITGAQLAEMQRRYPSIEVKYTTITSVLTFANWDGTIITTQTITNGGNGSYAGSTPTMASDAQYTYTFANAWSLVPDGPADANAFKNVTIDRTVYPVFDKTLRTYTVTWKNGSTTLETDSNVPYGTMPTYNGAIPMHQTSPKEYEFDVWEPVPQPIVGDTTYTATFALSYMYVKLANERIAGEYNNRTVSNIGEYAFEGNRRLEKAVFEAASTIKEYAFANCTNLTTLTLLSSTMVTLENVNAFDNTPIANGNGYIYVPADLVNTYKADSVWGPLSAKIKDLESNGHAYYSLTWEGVEYHQRVGDYANVYSVGNTVPINIDGTEYNATLVGIDVDETANGGTYAPLSWLVLSQIGSSTYRWNPAVTSVTTYPEVDAWARTSQANEWKTQTGKVIANATATWEVTAATRGTMNLRYQCSSSSSSNNTLSITVDGVVKVSNAASTSQRILALGMDAGETKKITVTYNLLTESNYQASIQFTGLSTTQTLVETNTIQRQQIIYDACTGTINGWADSEARAYVSAQMSKMPTVVQEMIVPVRKQQLAYDTTGATFEQQTIDSLWLLDTGEATSLYGNVLSWSSSAEWYKIFSNHIWTRSVSSNNYARTIHYSSGTSSAIVTSSYYLGVLGFCTGYLE